MIVVDSLQVNLDSLLIQLQSHVTPKWYEFGIIAGIEREVLDKFAKQCSPEDCIVEMLDYWLRGGEKPTWREVAKILRSIYLPQLAQDIEGVYTTGNQISLMYNTNYGTVLYIMPGRGARINLDFGADY